MAERLKFVSMGISVEGEKHILEDLVRTIREAEHEGIEASNPISDLIYSIEVGLQLNGMGRDVEEEEEYEEPKVATSAASRLDRLKAYKENDVALKAAKEQSKQGTAQELIGIIKGLKPRIDELLETANACLEAGIEINAYSKSFYHDLDKYERGTFVTNGISHRVGFVQDWPRYDKRSHAFTELGIDNGGACGPYDFRTNGEMSYLVHEKNREDVKKPSIEDMEKFLRGFDEFESAFYSYVDKEIEKQPKSVDTLLSGAKERAERGGMSARMARQLDGKEF